MQRRSRSKVQYRPRDRKTGMFPGELEIYKKRPKVRGVKYEYESESLPYTIAHDYFPDFTIHLPSGSKFYVEVKGWFRPEDKTKMRAVKAANPDADIRMVFPKAPGKKNIEWCIKYGVPFAIGGIPREWVTTEDDTHSSSAREEVIDHGDEAED